MWVAVEDPHTDSPFESIMCAEIARLTFNSDKEPTPGLFRYATDILVIIVIVTIDAVRRVITTCE